MRRFWDKAYSIAYAMISSIPQQIRAPTFTNKTTRRLLKHLEHLRIALLEMNGGVNGTASQQRAAVLCTTKFPGDDERREMLREIRGRNADKGYNSDQSADEPVDDRDMGEEPREPEEERQEVEDVSMNSDESSNGGGEILPDGNDNEEAGNEGAVHEDSGTEDSLSEVEVSSYGEQSDEDEPKGGDRGETWEI